MKYIVYETTNLVNGKIYVGYHATKDPEKFDGYLGCGININQPSTYKDCKIKTAFQHAVMKYGFKSFKRKVLAVFDTWEEASNLEAQIVNEEFLSRSDVYNMIVGGVDDHFYLKIKVYQYDLEGNFVAEYDSMQSAANHYNCDHGAIWHAVYNKQKAKGFFWNTDKLDKLDLSNYNIGLNHQIKIYVYALDGTFYKEYCNQTQASKDLKIDTAKIKECRILGIPYKDLYFCTEKDSDYSKARLKYIHNRPVYKYSAETGEFICGYKTQLEAELENPNSNISKSIKLKTPCKSNYLWGLEQYENYNKPIKVNAKRKVGKYDLEGNLVYVYNSATAAANENGTSVWKVLNGTNKTHKKHIYKYLE